MRDVIVTQQKNCKKTQKTNKEVGGIKRTLTLDIFEWGENMIEPCGIS